MHESMEYLYNKLKECEQECKNCGRLFEHLFEQTEFFDNNGPIPNCSNANQKAALKRVIAKRLARLE